MPVRARDLGIAIGSGSPGPHNAITDVAGIRVGHATLIRGDGQLRVGAGPVRTGVTVVVPHDGDVWAEPLFAGCHTLNGNGEMTGTDWVRDSGLLAGVVAITNTHSVGVVRDALVAHPARAHGRRGSGWALPVVGETYDGLLSDADGFHVQAEHVDAAIAAATPGPVAEGGVGGGTGSVCHEFKGGIGTASRVLRAEDGGWTVGVLVQANYGRRRLLRVDGVRVGEAIPTSDIPSPYDQRARLGEPGAGSIIVVVATDAPLLPSQCRRVAERAGMGLARMGSIAATSSGDLFLCFASGNRGIPSTETDAAPLTHAIRMVRETGLNPVFEAAIEATEEAIVNALVAAETMTGRDGITAHRLPHDRLVEVMRRAGRVG